MKSFDVKIVVPDKEHLTVRANAVIAPSTEGEIEILADHKNMLILLDLGNIRIVKDDGEDISLFFASAVLEICNGSCFIVGDRTWVSGKIDQQATLNMINKKNSTLLYIDQMSHGEDVREMDNIREEIKTLESML